MATGHPPQMWASKPEHVWMEAEVEYVRTQTVVFATDPNDGLSSSSASPAAGRVLRSLNYFMHRGKDMVRGEKPKLLRWRVIPSDEVGTALGSALLLSWGGRWWPEYLNGGR